MSDDDHIRQATLHVVAQYQALLSQGRWDEWIGLWAEDGELDFPFAPAGRQRLYRGREAILRYMRAASGKMVIEAVASARLIPAQDPRVAVAELSIRGHAAEGGAPYDQSYVLVFETEDGLLKRYREYWNPLVSIDAFGGREAWTAHFGFPAADAAA
ncbi:nuclear transport factor 2 family protein [Caulobacter sp. KR2-114]|uniref:nuclear transport factor 2 family protein n=1 Tax=Caulobacter sp. KR2-114 TaxID=3400912 RepID=UPI003C109E43